MDAFLRLSLVLLLAAAVIITFGMIRESETPLVKLASVLMCAATVAMLFSLLAAVTRGM